MPIDIETILTNSNETFSDSIKKIEKELNLNQWGFEMVALRLYPKYEPRAIFQSKKCIVAFQWRQERPYTEPYIYTTYARKHASFDGNLMIWNGQKHHCWHSDFSLLSFLDDLQPRQITYNEFLSPFILKVFYNSNEENYIGERAARRALLIWNHYGDRFFNLLDLQYPELWEKYSNFLKEFYERQDEITKQKGLQPINLAPPFYMVC